MESRTLYNWKTLDFCAVLSPAEQTSNLCPTHFRPAKYAELSSSPMNACERIPLRAHGWCSVSLATMRYTGIPPPSSAAMPRGQKKAPGSRGPGAQGGGDLLSRPSRAVPSARAGLTALFGMGRGGAPPRWPPCQRLGTAAGAGRQAEGRGGGRRGGGAPRARPRGPGRPRAPRRRPRRPPRGPREALGPLVPVGPGVAAAPPPAYPRGRLPRP